MKGTQPIRVMCVDDHRLVCEGVAALINQQPDMEVIARAANGEQAVALYREHQPDVTLMDLELPVMSGLEAIRAIRREYQNARIIVLTVHQSEEDIFRAVEEGAATYLLKDSLVDEVADRIRAVHLGRNHLSPDIKARLDERKSHKPLSTRELQIVELIAKGMRNKEIAAVLGISDETVPVHMRRLFAKLGVNDRTAALAVALRRGLVRIR